MTPMPLEMRFHWGAFCSFSVPSRRSVAAWTTRTAHGLAKGCRVFFIQCLVRGFAEVFCCLLQLLLCFPISANKNHAEKEVLMATKLVCHSFAKNTEQCLRLHSFASFIVSSPASSLSSLQICNLGFRYPLNSAHAYVTYVHQRRVSLIEVSTGPSDASSAFSLENILTDQIHETLSKYHAINTISARAMSGQK